MGLFSGGFEDPEVVARKATEKQTIAGEKAINTINNTSDIGRQQLLRSGILGQERLEPFSQIGQQGLAQADFLGNPQAQANFLANNPLYQAQLENANQATLGNAASRGLSGSAGVQAALAQNQLATAQPFLDTQRQDILSQLQLGLGVAGQQNQFGSTNAQNIANLETNRGSNIANLQTGIGAAQSAGLVGGNNAAQQSSDALTGNLFSLIGAAASDIRLKEDIKEIGTMNGYKKYSWKWNKLAEEKLNLHGSEEGVIAQEVELVNPDLIVMHNGFKHVKYGEL